jgi:hypothetical protein
LQPFFPAQALPAPWQELCPLHALMPEHITSSPPPKPRPKRPPQTAQRPKPQSSLP